MVRRRVQKRLQPIKQENLDSDSHDYESDTIILEILAEKFVGSLQDLQSSVEASKKLMPRSIEDYDLIKDILCNVFFKKKCTETQIHVYRVKIVNKKTF